MRPFTLSPHQLLSNHPFLTFNLWAILLFLSHVMSCTQPNLYCHEKSHNSGSQSSWCYDLLIQSLMLWGAPTIKLFCCDFITLNLLRLWMAMCISTRSPQVDQLSCSIILSWLQTTKTSSLCFLSCDFLRVTYKQQGCFSRKLIFVKASYAFPTHSQPVAQESFMQSQIYRYVKQTYK